MAEVNPPLYEQGGCYTALQDRQLVASYVCSEGVQNKTAGDLLVTDGASGMQVVVAAGDAFVQGDDAINQGMYYVVNDANVTLTPDNGGAGARTDVVIAEVLDAQYGDPSNTWVLRVVKGTEGGPVPTTPANAIALAQLAVGAGATTLAPGNITDVRPQARFCPQMLPDVVAASEAAWTSYTPVVAQGATSNIAKNITYAKYQKVGKTVTGTVAVTITGAGTAGSAITVSLPLPRSTVAGPIGTCGVWNNGVNFYSGVAWTSGSTTVASFRWPGQTTGAFIGNDPSWALKNTDEIYFEFTYETP